MSIIERAAELLRSAPQGQQGRPAASEKGEMRRLDLIERASADLAQTTGGEAPLERRKTSAPERSSSKVTRQLAVDRNRLRALSLITPDGERTPLAESFRRIKRQILSNIDKPKPGAPPANLVMVTSALAGEGKTFCAINLAISGRRKASVLPDPVPEVITQRPSRRAHRSIVSWCAYSG